MIKWLFLIAIFCVGCESVVEVELPKEAPQITLNAIVNTDGLVTVNLTKSRPGGSGGAAFENINNAEVLFYKNDQRIGQLLYQGNGNYSLAGVVATEPMALYSIKVNAAGLKSAEATEKMTKTPLISSFSAPPYSNSNYLYKDFQVSLTLNDDPENNYYLFRAFLKSPTSKDIISVQLNNDLGQFSPVGTREATVFTDKLFNGKPVILNLEISNLLVSQGPHSIVIEVSNISRTYYDYEYTARKQLTNDPLFGQEYVPVSSNVKNGLGVFAAYNSVSSSFEVKR